MNRSLQLWLGLAAAPTLAVMALAAASPNGGPLASLCGAAPRFALGGMSQMYLVMSVFHLSPWLELARRAVR
jgi:hypothetical protein